MEDKKSDPPVTRSEFLKEIDNLATKEGLNKLANEIIKTQADLKKVKETMASKEDVSKILNAIDAFAQKAENYDRKALFHDSRINDHEQRITQLEKTASQ